MSKNFGWIFGLFYIGWMQGLPLSSYLPSYLKSVPKKKLTTLEPNFWHLKLCYKKNIGHFCIALFLSVPTRCIMFLYLLYKKSYYKFCKLGQNVSLEKCCKFCKIKKTNSWHSAWYLRPLMADIEVPHHFREGMVYRFQKCKVHICSLRSYGEIKANVLAVFFLSDSILE